MKETIVAGQDTKEGNRKCELVKGPVTRQNIPEYFRPVSDSQEQDQTFAVRKKWCEKGMIKGNEDTAEMTGSEFLEREIFLQNLIILLSKKYLAITVVI